MKVIKEGKEIEGIMWVTCRICEAELEIQAGDLKKSSNRFEPTTYYYTCPCCRRTNYLRYSDLSEEIRFDLNNQVKESPPSIRFIEGGRFVYLINGLKNTGKFNHITKILQLPYNVKKYMLFI